MLQLHNLHIYLPGRQIQENLYWAGLFETKSLLIMKDTISFKTLPSIHRLCYESGVFEIKFLYPIHASIPLNF